MLQKTVSRRALALEPLEQKNLLAGDVTVSIVDGDILVSGDQASNHVRIVADPAEGEFVIRGLPSADGTVTTLNGQAGAVRVDGLNRDLNIRLGGGHDAVDLSAGPFRNVGISTGRGADIVRVGRVDPSAELAESSDDPGSARDVVLASLSIATGRGPDRVFENDLFVAGLHRIHTGQGTDLVQLGAAPSDATDRLGVRSGGDLNIRLATGHDTLRADKVDVAGVLRIDGGRGGDDLRLTRVASSGAALVRGGHGSDRLTVSDSQMEDLAIDAGAGHDRAAVVDSAFVDLRISMGDGRDRIALGASSARAGIVLLGGAGRDTLVTWGGNQSRHYFVGQVEHFVDGSGDELDEDDDRAGNLLPSTCDSGCVA